MKPVEKIVRPRASWEEQPIVQPPSTLTVQHDHKAVLYRADGTPLVRKAGF